MVVELVLWVDGTRAYPLVQSSSKSQLPIHAASSFDPKLNEKQKVDDPRASFDDTTAKECPRCTDPCLVVTPRTGLIAACWLMIVGVHVANSSAPRCPEVGKRAEDLRVRSKGGRALCSTNGNGENQSTGMAGIVASSTCGLLPAAGV